MKKPKQVKNYKQLSARVTGAKVRRAFKCECPGHNTRARVEVVVRVITVLVALSAIFSALYWLWTPVVASGSTVFALVNMLVLLPVLIFLLVLGERLERRRWIRLHEKYVIEEGIPSYIRGKITETRDKLVGHGSRFHKLVTDTLQVLTDATRKKEFVERLRSDANKAGLFCSNLDRQANKLDKCLQLQMVADELGKCEKLIVDYRDWQRWRIALIAAKHRTTSLDVYGLSVMRELWVAEAKAIFSQLHALAVKFETVFNDTQLTFIAHDVRQGTDANYWRQRVSDKLYSLKYELEKISPGFSPMKTSQNEKNLSA